MAAQFDVLHFHIDQFHFPIFRHRATRTLTTLHGRQDLPDLKHLYAGFRGDAACLHFERPAPPHHRCQLHCDGATRYPAGLAHPDMHPRGGYLAFLGRISPEKRVDRAIAIARAAGLPLKIAAKVDHADDAYFTREIAPLLSQPGIEFIGEIDEQQKGTFLGQARALLFPIDWPEPFGLVMIEAMACGTPVLAFRQGSAPEVVEDGITGYVVESMEEAIGKVGRVMALDRGRIRRRFEQRFTADRMARDYLNLYRRLLGIPMREPAPPAARHISETDAAAST